MLKDVGYPFMSSCQITTKNQFLPNIMLQQRLRTLSNLRRLFTKEDMES